MQMIPLLSLRTIAVGITRNYIRTTLLVGKLVLRKTTFIVYIRCPSHRNDTSLLKETQSTAN